METFLFGLVGFFAGGLVNVLADDLPLKTGVGTPHCRHCDYRYRSVCWLAIGRLVFRRGRCPRCALPESRRHLLVEVGVAASFAYLSLVLTRRTDIAFLAGYAAILILIIVIDIEHRIIPHKVTLPATGLALIGSLFVGHTTLPLSILGAFLGFAIFFLFLLLGRFLYGPGALGFGDVTLAMTMGAMLGFPLIAIALLLGMILAGLFSFTLIVARLRSRHSTMAYGSFLAAAGLATIAWGPDLYKWYFA